MKLVNWFVFLSLFLCINFFSASPGNSQLPPFDDSSVVKIYVFADLKLDMVDSLAEANPVLGLGSGLMIEDQGLILTAKHVVESSRFLAVKVPGYRLIYPADVVYKDPNYDFALISVIGKFNHYAPLPSATQALSKGRRVCVYGYPMLVQEQIPTINCGDITLFSSTFNLWQTNAAVNPGNSGGPVVDDSGLVIGIVLSKLTEAERMNYILSINDVAEIYKELKAAGQINRNAYSPDRTRARILLSGIIEELAFDPENLPKEELYEKISDFVTSKKEEDLTIKEMSDLLAIASASLWDRVVDAGRGNKLTTLLQLFSQYPEDVGRAIQLAYLAKDYDNTVIQLAYVSLMNKLRDAIRDTNTIKTKQLQVTLSSPNGGEKWQAGSYQYIRWETVKGEYEVQYKLEYSTDDSTTWETILDWSDLNTGYYRWTVPNTYSKKCLIKVSCRDKAGNEGSDMSDKVFRIER